MELMERHWWVILVNAECAGEQDLAAHNLSVRARVMLRDKYKINLDGVWDEAQNEFYGLLEEERTKLKEEEVRRKRIEELMNRSNI
jgi:hypothetical protein